ncbi:hypothetical protein [Rhodococcus qingshengii]|uniref:hypothetical protein n=1 Tax=Rhodococcus qingshengii TaxID=334542 RepID=UPI00287FBF60|nr:hypothetical protein [Rhodococcus qingshengii]
MSVIVTEDFTDIGLTNDDVTVEFAGIPIRPKSSETGLITAKPVVVRTVNGKVTSPSLDGGPARIRVSAGSWVQAYDVVLPDTGSVRLRTLLENYVVYEPPVVGAVSLLRDEVIAAAAAVEGLSTAQDAAVADLVASETETTAAVDARVRAVGDGTYAPIGSGGAGIVKDSGTGMYAIASGSSLIKDVVTGMYSIGV